MKERAMALVADAGKDRLGRGPEADDERMATEGIEVGRVDGEAAAGGA